VSAAHAPSTVILDVNGTLTDPAAIGAPWGRDDLGETILDHAVHTAMVCAILERGEPPFSDHLRAAIEVVVAREALDPGEITAAAEAARRLPARPDALAALTALTDAGHRLVALTNSGAEAGRATLRACGLLDRIDDVLGVDAVGRFKPHPAVYRYALEQLAAPPGTVIMLATHPWDLAGAAQSGMSTAWVTHGMRAWPSVFPRPTHDAATLRDLAELLIR
jgi:2-haloacid dehalogenase